LTTLRRQNKLSSPCLTLGFVVCASPSPTAKLIYDNKVDKGGHFAAWEQPRLFAAEVRAAFRSLR